MRVKPISGFPEHLPADCLAEQELIRQIRTQYELYGFSPLETCAVERMDVLLSKGDMGRQIYGLTRAAEDDSSTDMGLHFDLTVPLARYVVQNAGQLVFPFRRYQIQKVWRGERAQKGRFKEFYQCDIDIVGRQSLDPIYEAEVPAIIDSVFSALKLPQHIIHVSDRRIWDDFAATFDIAADRLPALLGILDKTHKVGVEKVREELSQLGFGEQPVTVAMNLIACHDIASASAVLSEAGVPTTSLELLSETIENANRFGCPASAIRPDFSIARGLDYYTGTVYETFIDGYLKWGSVCSGGRYDNLTEIFGGQKFPGVGISIGLSRLFSLLKQEDLIQSEASSPAVVLVTMLDKNNYFDQYLNLARELRGAGIPTEVYFGKKGLGDQISVADKRGIPFALIAGETEFANQQFKLKDLAKSEECTGSLAELISQLQTHAATNRARFVLSGK
ncbi:MAG: histidine--tRNA ligase [Planctomycetaceae bacterium]|nr:histidine--tRNA ligase [Planctomycetaceae bacterium]MCB9951094.1 histidine--tRNA ligase [Planctomycetaceae bacterium]